MPQWTIKSVSNEPICTVKSVERHGQLMSGRWLTVDIDSPIALPLSAGCYIDFNNVRYSIRSQADVEKSARPQSNGGAFTYKDLRLDDVSWQELEDTQMCDYVYGDNHLHYSGLGSFSFFAVNASDVGYRVLANLANKYGDSAWDVRINGSSIKSDYTDYTFDEAKSVGISSGTSVKDALDLLWSNWGVYYTVENHVVDIVTSSNGVSIPLKYGKNNGLKSIRRKINQNVEICTRVRAYGSERNMPYKWYNNKYNSVFGDAMYVPQLMLPHYAYIKSQNEVEFIDENGDLYDDRPPHYQYNLWATPSDIVLPSNNDIIQKYGKRDKEVHWNSDEMGEIFPSMKGMTSDEIPALREIYGDHFPLDHLLSTAVNEDGTTITGTGDTSELTTGKINFKVRVPNPGFDPMAQKGQEDVVLLMQSGMCQSRGFVILKSEAVTDNEQVVAYDLTCVKAIDDEIDQVFPNVNYTIEGGQEYVYTGLTFSGNDLSNSWLTVYIGAAEKRLLRAAALWLREHQTEQYVYEITPDNVYLQKQKDDNVNFEITEGDTISLSQDDLGDSEEVVETVTVVYGKEAIPTYEITFLKRDESESLGDRVKGLVGQTISVDSDIAKMNDSLYRKVNKAGFHTLFDPLDAQYNVLDINGDLSTLRYIRANVDFFGVSGVSSLGRSSGGGGGVPLNDPLDSINNDLDANPSGSNKILYYNGTTWDYTDLPTGGGGGTDLLSVWKSLTNDSSISSYGNNTKISDAHIPDLYLLKTGGAVAYLTVNNGALRIGGNSWIENENNVRFYLPNPQDTSVNYTLATTADIQNVDLTGYATESWVKGKHYLTSNQNIDLTGDVTGSGTTSIDVRIGNEKVTNAMLAGNIANSKLEHYSISIAGETVTLGGSISDSTLLTKVQSTFDGRYVTKGTTQEISGQKTFTASLLASNDIYLNKRYQQQWVNFNNQTKNFSFGQELGGDCVLYSGVPDDVDKVVNFYTNINGNPYSLFIQGSTGNVGIGTNNPTYKFDVSGNIHTNSAYYLDGRLFANNDTNNNTGLHIGYEYAVDDSENPSPLPTTLWGDGISFRSAGGTYGGCTKIDDTHGNITYGIMATDFIGVTDKFRFEYDLQNNTVWVLKANGQPVNFASFGGVTSLGVGSSGTPNISSMNIATLMTTNTTVGNQLNIGTSGTNNGQINFYDADETGGASIAVNSGDLHITSDSTTYIESLLSVDGNITADGEVKGTSLHTRGGNLTMGGGNILMGGGRIYLDATRYLYLNGSSLMYYNGTSSKNVA